MYLDIHISILAKTIGIPAVHKCRASTAVNQVLGKPTRIVDREVYDGKRQNKPGKRTGSLLLGTVQYQTR